MYYTSLIILSKSQPNWSSSSRENAEKQFFLRAKALAKNNVASRNPAKIVGKIPRTFILFQSIHRLQSTERISMERHVQ